MLFIDLSLSSIGTFFEDNKYLKSGNSFNIALNDISPLTESPILLELATLINE
jgi:hypothetical protein